mgnify:CR=1 FL=1
MHNDLFFALQNARDRRQHPILLALAYAYCPAAARWWQAGADPTPPFDPRWQALTDLAAGKTLREALDGYGFGELTRRVRPYIDQVAQYRANHPDIPHPELTPLFGGGRLDIDERFGHDAAIQAFGGRWENFFSYIHTWAFLASDWKRDMHLPVDAPIRLEELALGLPGMRPVRWPALRFGDGRIDLGLLCPDGAKDSLRFELVSRAQPVEGRPWEPGEVQAWALYPMQGARAHDCLVPDELLPDLVQNLAQAARDGPWPPSGALSVGWNGQCVHCPFAAQCYQFDPPQRLLSPLAAALGGARAPVMPNS